MERVARGRAEDDSTMSNPYRDADAVEILLGRKSLIAQPQAQVLPTPTGAQPGQPLPATPAQVAQAVQLNTPAEIEAYVKTLDAKQEGEFWKRMGLPWKDITAFKGI